LSAHPSRNIVTQLEKEILKLEEKNMREFAETGKAVCKKKSSKKLGNMNMRQSQW
jgi:hypothetical protein